MTEITISFKNVSTRKGLHKVIEEQLPVPEWYGHNLDALFDVLNDITEDIVITLVDFQELDERLGKYYQSFKKMITAASYENEHLTFVWMEDASIDEDNVYMDEE